MENSSARNLWGDYLDSHLEYAFVDEARVTNFCDNEKDANECLKLVLSGTKRATTHSLLGLQMRKERLPKIGDFTIVLQTEHIGRKFSHCPLGNSHHQGSGEIPIEIDPPGHRRRRSVIDTLIIGECKNKCQFFQGFIGDYRQNMPNLLLHRILHPLKILSRYPGWLQG